MGAARRGLAMEEGVARRLWKNCKNEFTFAIYTPFFICLASGDLDSSCFIHFLSQHSLFLSTFIHAYELAEDCADDDEDKIAIRKLSERLKDKLKHHASIVKEWGFQLPEENFSDDATIKYRDFLLATAVGKVDGEKVSGRIATPFERTKVAAYIIGASAPYMRVYAETSKEIRRLIATDNSSHMYKKWINNSHNFEALALQTEELLNRLSISLTGEELDIVKKLYVQAMKLETEFFSTQQIVQKTIVPLSRVQGLGDCHLTLFCDFDMTCTAVDSSAILAEIAVATAAKVDPNSSEYQLSHRSSADLRKSWDVLATQYVQEYDHCIQSVVCGKTGQNFDYEGLFKCLDQLGDFEKEANLRVIQAEVLKGLNIDDIEMVAQSLAFQDGCKSFFQNIIKTENLNAAVHIISYCWCGDLVRSAFSSGDLSVLNVHSNELAYDEFISTGGIVLKLQSPMDKLQAFKEVLKGSSSDAQELTVYVGGSVGDLLCLLEADIGIVIGKNPILRKLSDHFGISYRPLFSELVKKQKELAEHGSLNWRGKPGTLYTVDSWAEIHAFMIGY